LNSGPGHSSWERWRLAGEFWFSAPDRPETSAFALKLRRDRPALPGGLWESIIPFGFGQQKAKYRRQEQRAAQNPEGNGDAVRPEF